MVSIFTLKAGKLAGAEAGLFDNGHECFFRNIFSRMVWDNGSAMRCRIIPDFMAALGVSVKYKTRFAELANYFIRSK